MVLGILSNIIHIPIRLIIRMGEYYWIWTCCDDV